MLLLVAALPSARLGFVGLLVGALVRLKMDSGGGEGYGGYNLLVGKSVGVST